MKKNDRIVLAVAIVLGDFVVIAFPICALVLAYVLVARPPWFRDWVEKIYAGE